LNTRNKSCAEFSFTSIFLITYSNGPKATSANTQRQDCLRQFVLEQESPINLLCKFTIWIRSPRQR